jgi:hypothetical protein
VGDNGVFYFFTGKEGLLVQLNAAGQKTKEVRVPASDVFGSVVSIKPAGNGDFYLTYPIDADKKGYVVARYGPDLTAKWQKEFAPDKGKYRVRYFEATPAAVYAVVDNSKAGLEVSCLDGATGAEKSRLELQPAASGFEPTMTAVDPAGQLLVAGTYRDQQKTAFISTEKPGTPPPGGLFVLGLGPDGKQAFVSRMSYAADLAGKLNTRSTLQPFTVGEVPALKLHALVPRPGGGYAFIGETYKVFTFTNPQYDAAGGVRAPGTGGVGPGPERRNILDFVVLELSAQGQLQSLRRIPKPYKIYQNHNPGGGPKEFENETAFAYRFLQQPDPAKLPEVVFLNWHQNLLYVNSLKTGTDTRDNLFTRRYLDQPAVPGAADRGELTVRSFSNDINKPPVELFYDEILPHAPGKFVYSHYEPSKSSLRLQVLDLPGK